MKHPRSDEKSQKSHLDLRALRKQMVHDQLEARGIQDCRVLKAMGSVPREAFVPENLKSNAYDDGPLPIGAAQTISQPFIVALMIEALEMRGGEHVLEIGTGSGYAAAVLGQIAANVDTVERIPELAHAAARRLKELHCENVQVHVGDGTLGWPEHAPYDAIVVAAGGPEVPDSLRQQLKVGGRLVMPVGGSRQTQELVRVRRVRTDEFQLQDLGGVRFVPLIGQEGWDSPNDF
jgi:protein-L-isoaspartate(D-aspartate) O-methyltransferase